MIRKGLVTCWSDYTYILREWEPTGGMEQGNNMIAFERNHSGCYNVLKGLFKDCNEARETSQWVAAVTGEGPNWGLH